MLRERIIRDNFSESVTGQISPDLAGQRREIRNLQTGQTVGYANVDVHQNFLETESLGFLHELLLSSILGGLLTIAIATLLAVSLSNRITAPITALTQAAEAIAQHDHASLLPVDSSDELGQMSVAFNQMTCSLIRQRHVRRRLINDISHELNTPLTVIHLEAKGLLDGLQTSAQAARHIIQEVNMLRNLTNDLNWLAETDSGELQLNLEQCAIDQLLTSEVERWQAQAEAHQIKLSIHLIPALPALQLDPVRMRQALDNIIHNALQHTEHGHVILTASMEDDKYVQISVKDDGGGYPRRIYRTFSIAIIALTNPAVLVQGWGWISLAPLLKRMADALLSTAKVLAVGQPCSSRCHCQRKRILRRASANSGVGKCRPRPCRRRYTS